MLRFNDRLRVLSLATAVVLPMLFGAQVRARETPVGTVSNGGDDCVVTATLVQTARIQANGSVAPNGSSTGNLATKYTYRLAGDIFTQVAPPPGWKPVGASDQELLTYGFPKRPTDPTARSRWNQAFSSWRYNVTSGLCETNKYNTSFFSGNWAGGFNINDTTNVNTYNDSYTQYTEPTFVETCPSASAYSIWSGLGGWNYNNGQQRLIQAGTDTASALNVSYLFWELWSTDNRYPEIRSSAQVSPGDAIVTDSEFNSTYGYASMYAYDAASGVNFSSGQIYTYHGVAAQTFWDGSTSDYITEAPTESDGHTTYQLREPSTGYESIPYILVNGKSLGSYKSDPIYQGIQGQPLVQTTTFDGHHGWIDIWQKCHI